MKIQSHSKNGILTTYFLMPRLLEGDYNSNGPVEQGDLDLVMLNWGEELAEPCDAGWINDFPSGLIE